MRWPWSKPTPSEAARILAKSRRGKTARGNRDLIRATVDEMCRAMNRPAPDWNNLTKEKTNV